MVLQVVWSAWLSTLGHAPSVMELAESQNVHVFTDTASSMVDKFVPVSLQVCLLLPPDATAYCWVYDVTVTVCCVQLVLTLPLLLLLLLFCGVSLVIHSADGALTNASTHLLLLLLECGRLPCCAWLYHKVIYCSYICVCTINMYIYIHTYVLCLDNFFCRLYCIPPHF